MNFSGFWIFSVFIINRITRWLQRGRVKMSIVAGSYEKFIWEFKLKNLKKSQTLTSNPALVLSLPPLFHPVCCCDWPRRGLRRHWWLRQDLWPNLVPEIGTITDHSNTITSLSFPRKLLSAPNDCSIDIYDVDPFIHLTIIASSYEIIVL